MGKPGEVKLRKRVSSLIATVKRLNAKRLGDCPKTTAALISLEKAVGEEFAAPSGAKARGRAEGIWGRAEYYQRYRLKKEVARLKKELALHRTTRTEEYQLKKEWMVRVF